MPWISLNDLNHKGELLRSIFFW